MQRKEKDNRPLRRLVVYSLTCAQVGHKLDGKKSRDILAEQVGQSKNQIQRYIRLIELIPKLMDMVDEKEDCPEPCL